MPCQPLELCASTAAFGSSSLMHSVHVSILVFDTSAYRGLWSCAPAQLLVLTVLYVYESS